MKRTAMLLGLAMACGAQPLFAATTLNVYVKDPSGAGIAGAQVAAMRFGDNGPDAINSRLAVTNASGLAQFSAADSLSDGYDYEIFASTQGYLPSIRDQYNSPDHRHVTTSGGAAADVTITLSNSGVSEVGEIDATISNATNNGMVFGSIRPNNSANNNEDAIAFGMIKLAGTGGTMKIFNVPFAAANSYRVDAYDPALNKGVSQVVNLALDVSNPLRSGFALNFNNSIPPQRYESQVQQSAGGVAVEGVVVDTNSVNVVPNIGLTFQYFRNDPYCGNFCLQSVWSQTNENGRFQLYGLQPNTSYYAQVYGGCSWMTSICYDSYDNPAFTANPSTNVALGVNDFYYDGTAIVKQIKLNQVSGGSGKIQVYVKDSSGSLMPQVGVSIWPDGINWETGGSCAANNKISKPGLANSNTQATTGYALLENLPAGNYGLQIWTPFSKSKGIRLNDGPNGKSCWQEWEDAGRSGPSCQCGTDDYRLAVSTTGPNFIRIYNSSGTPIGAAVSSVTVTVDVPDQVGLLRGTFHFPGAGIDLSNDPVNITLQPNCGSNNGPCTGGGYTSISGASVGPDVAYAVHVATGQSYWMNITSRYWGIVRDGGGNNQVSFESTGTVTMDIKFAPAGRLVGKLYKPDGSLFTPSFGMNGVSANINASGQGVEAWGWTQVNKDGTFDLGGLLPGTYRLDVGGWGNFTYANPRPQPTAVIAANKTTYQDLRVVEGVPVKIDVSTNSLPRMAIANCNNAPERTDCPPETWVAKGLAKGTLFDQQVVAGLLFHEGDSANDEFGFAASTGNRNPCRTNIDKPGWCVNRVPSPTVFDMYLLRRGGFDQAGIAFTRPYFTVLNSSKNVMMQTSLATTPYYWQNSTLTVLPINLTPAADMSAQGQSAVNGTVTGQNILRKADFDSFGGKFQNFMKYIPLVTLYDAEENFSAAGLVVPNPMLFTPQIDMAFNRAVAEGDWAAFQSLGAAFGAWGYEIRGLAPGKTYTAVVTSPNYPPYQGSVTTGVSGSTVTLNVNMDTMAGAGGSLTGVVTSTNSAAISGAFVSIEADGYKKKTAETDASGACRFDGLPVGSYKVSVVASGYALAAALKDVSGTSLVTANFALKAAGSAITGTVYSQKVPFVKVQPGAELYAYNDTYNGQNPSAELPLYRAVTSSAGFYRLDGLEVGQIYKVFLKVPGKYVLNQSTLTVLGTVSGLDFTMFTKPLDIEVFGYPTSAYYEFVIQNPSDFKTGNAWIGEAPFVKASAADVSSTFQQMPNNQLMLKYPLASLNAAREYVLHIEGLSLSGKTVTRELIFGLTRKANAVQAIDTALIGDDSSDAQGRKSNQASLDASGANPSAVSMPAGAMIPVSTAAVPACQFTHTDVQASTVAAMVGAVSGGAAAFASGVYQVALSSVNFTARGFDLSLAYDKGKSKISDVAIHHYNEVTKKWEVVPGLQTIDPVKGTVNIKRIKSLSTVSAEGSRYLSASWDGKTYTPNAYNALALSDSGSFAVLKPSVAGDNYTGAAVKVFNFPNPFNLDDKTVPIVNGGATTSIPTTGTVIKYELPGSVSGHVYVRIYTLAGELVRELDEGDKPGGKYYYTEWDGKNGKGQKVANGVYYGILSVPGVKAKDATFKMAVIK